MGVKQGTYEQFQISKAKVSGIKTSQPMESKQAYRPPGARGAKSTFKLHDDDEDAENIKKNNAQGAAGLLADPDKEKKIRKVNDKLAKIDKLKAQLAEGKALEKNQLDSLTKEAGLLDELKALTI